jgi:hypothetical protein
MQQRQWGDWSRREFLASAGASQLPAAREPWYRRTLRWGQTNITEADPPRYDIAWWRAQWKRTLVQGVIINAGGIVAYYPSRFPHHRRAAGLGDRDLFGELTRAAHSDGLVVLARMDSNRAPEGLYREHPDWFAVDGAGRPYRSAEDYLACVHGPYYQEYLPAIWREIIERSHPEGFTDNSWSGLERDQICYCPHCRRKFRERSGRDLPVKADWGDGAYRDWIRWNYERRLELWETNTRLTRQAGGPDCLWLGMTHGSVSGQSRKFRDYKALCERSEIVMLDYQARGEDGVAHNAEMGALIHGLLGWDKLIPESMPMYQMGRPTFRLSSKPAAEARMWMVAGFAGGIQPWWHHIGAWHEDRRMYETAAPVMRWHQENERYLVGREPVAGVGVVWSQLNMDFYGQDQAGVRVEQPWRGVTHALIRHRIPYLPVHADHLARDAGKFAALVLPSMGVLTEEQLGALREYVRRGGGLIVTGESGMYDVEGRALGECALAGLLGVSGVRAGAPGSGVKHTYLRMAEGPRHEVLAGFAGTEILPFGGELGPARVEAGDARVLLTYVPPFPMYPPETSWMREPRTDVPGLVVREVGAGRVAWLRADLDRQYGVFHLPDHGRLLANVTRWACRGRTPLEVEGRGAVDCRLYRQERRFVLHLVNLTQGAAWGGPMEEFSGVGPYRVRVREEAGWEVGRGRLLVKGGAVEVRRRAGWVEFEVGGVEDHEVVVLE